MIIHLLLGQARQEELLEYLFKNCDDPGKLRELFINLSPFYKNAHCGEQESQPTLDKQGD